MPFGLQSTNGFQPARDLPDYSGCSLQGGNLRMKYERCLSGCIRVLGLLAVCWHSENRSPWLSTLFSLRFIGTTWLLLVPFPPLAVFLRVGSIYLSSCVFSCRFPYHSYHSFQSHRKCFSREIGSALASFNQPGS